LFSPPACGLLAPTRSASKKARRHPSFADAVALRVRAGSGAPVLSLLTPRGWSSAANSRRRTMAAIGFVNGTIEKGFVGQLKTLSIRASIEISPNRSKANDVQPDFRVFSEGVEIGAGWVRTGEVSGNTYVSLSLAAPEFGPRRLYANLGRAAGQDDDDTYAVIWNPAD